MNTFPIIWVVDDSATERALTVRSLGEGFQIVEFEDGTPVVEVLGGGAPLPDVLLLDWVMPGMTGGEVCRFLRSHPRTQELPIILVTASRVETDDVVHGLALGANDYVARPFPPEELRARVGAVLRTKQLSDASRRERSRLAAINQLGRKLFAAGPDVDQILVELAATLTATMCDGCSVLLLPGTFPAASVARHRADPSAAALAAISTVADPVTLSFESSDDALAQLPPAYHAYIRRFGLSALSILPFPIRAPVEGVVTITRDEASPPLDADDLATIETCIEYASMAVQSAMRFDTERTGRAKLDAVLANAPVGIVVMNPAGVVTLANSAAIALIPGIDHADSLLAAFRLAHWFALDGTPIDEADWLRLRTSKPGQPQAAELVMQPRDGGPSRTLSVTTVPLIMDGGDGAQIGDVTTLEDISAERQITAERERIAKFQEQMLGIVGHDLRNPLGALLVGIEGVEIRAAEVPGVAPVLRRMKSASERMTRIVDQLLDVTRARLGNGIPIARREVALTPMLQGVLEELGDAHPDARFQLVANADVRGMWDVDRLCQVVANLASNAAQYGRPAEPIIIELSGTEDHASLTVTNTVRDQPIEADRLTLIFDPYKRGRDSHNHATGLGLGLYIVSEIVRAHHGTIRAESHGNRTVFRVELPRQLPGADG